jgi:putrescine transport system permease protein
MVFLLLVFLLPFLVVFKISVSEMEGVAFRDVVTWAEGAIHFHIKFDNYLGLAQDALYFQTYLSSLGFAALTTSILPVTGLSVCLLFGPQPGR